MRLALVAPLVLVAALVAGCRHTPPSDPAAEMRHQHDGDSPVASGAAAGADMLDVVTERVAYASMTQSGFVTGTLVRPAGVHEPLPGVIVIHEWWGLNDNVVDMAKRIAAEGYTVLAVDLYGGEAASTPDGAMALMRAALANPTTTDNLRQAYAYLADQQGATRVAVLGWCFGGGQSLQAALAMPTDLDAAVIYYGQPVTDAARLAALQMPVLGLFGGADSSIPADTVAAFEQALDTAGVANEIVIYPGAAHAFANPSGERYDRAAATDAWQRTTAFLAEHLRGASE